VGRMTRAESVAVSSSKSRRDLAEVGRGAAASLTTTVAAAVSGLAVTMLLTRTLGPGRYGAMAVALTVIGLVQTFTNAGIGNGAARMIAFARAQGDAAGAMRMLRSGIVVGLVTGLVGTLIVLALGLSHALDGFGVSLSLTVMAPLVLASSLRAAYGAAIRAYRDVRAIFILGLAAPLVDICLIAALVLMGVERIPIFAGALVVSAFIDLAISAILVGRHRRIGSLADSTLADTRALLAFSLPLLASQLLFFAMRSADVLMLGILRSPAEAGLYAPVMRLTEFSTKGLAAFSVLFVPIATGFVAKGQTLRLKELYASVTKWGYLIAFPVLLVLVAIPQQLLPLLFGRPYASMDKVAWVLAIGYWVILVTGLNGVTLGALGVVRPMAVVAAFGMAINIGLGVTLIPPLGPVGAAWANSLSYGFVNCAFSVILFRRTGISPFRRDTVTLFLFSGIVLVITTLVAQLPLFQTPGIAVGLAAAASLVWLAGALVARPFHMEARELRRLIHLRRSARGAAADEGDDGGSEDVVFLPPLDERSPGV
jgi:O-antigen/teichoic acid export membrane protein